MDPTKDKRINPVIYILIAWFSSAAWMASNTTWVEMSILTQQVPEGWSLASILIVTIQAASIFPLIFTIVDRCMNISLPHGKIIQMAMVVCALMYIPLIFAWDKTVSILGSPHSITLILCVFIFGIILIGSDIVFIPYMNNFETQYFPAYFVGIGLSALIPSVLSLIQGTSSHTCQPDPKTGELAPVYAAPRFSVSVLYFIVFIWVCGAVLAFYVLNNHLDKIDRLTSRFLNRKPQRLASQVELFNSEKSGDNELGAGAAQVTSSFPPPIEVRQPTQLEDTITLVLIASSAIQMNTIMPSFQSFASIPYSQETYFWSMILSTITAPISAFCAGIFPAKLKKLPILAVLSICCVCSTLFVVFLAFQSPNPWLKNSTWGSIMTVSVQIFSYSLGSFLRTVLIEFFRDGQPQNNSRLFYAGLGGQVGSFFGTCIVFPAINIFNWFEAAPLC